MPLLGYCPEVRSCPRNPGRCSATDLQTSWSGLLPHHLQLPGNKIQLPSPCECIHLTAGISCEGARSWQFQTCWIWKLPAPLPPTSLAAISWSEFLLSFSSPSFCWLVLKRYWNPKSIQRRSWGSRDSPPCPKGLGSSQRKRSRRGESSGEGLAFRHGEGMGNLALQKHRFWWLGYVRIHINMKYCEYILS